MRFTCDAHDIDVSGKNDDYVEARFDVLVANVHATNDSEVHGLGANPGHVEADAQHYNAINAKLAEARKVAS